MARNSASSEARRGTRPGHSRRENRGGPPWAAGVRDRRTLETASRLARDPARKRRVEILASYVRALPQDVDSLGGVKAALREDTGLLFEALLQGRREDGRCPQNR